MLKSAQHNNNNRHNNNNNNKPHSKLLGTFLLRSADVQQEGSAQGDTYTYSPLTIRDYADARQD